MQLQRKSRNNLPPGFREHDSGCPPFSLFFLRLSALYAMDFPTEMTRHFFASFCESSKCNLHIVAEGENMHHLIEAIF